MRHWYPLAAGSWCPSPGTSLSNLPFSRYSIERVATIVFEGNGIWPRLLESPWNKMTCLMQLLCVLNKAQLPKEHESIHWSSPLVSHWEQNDYIGPLPPSEVFKCLGLRGHCVWPNLDFLQSPHTKRRSSLGNYQSRVLCIDTLVKWTVTKDDVSNIVIDKLAQKNMIVNGGSVSSKEHGWWKRRILKQQIKLLTGKTTLAR